MDEAQAGLIKLPRRSSDAQHMNSAPSHALSLPRSAATSAARPRRSLWFHYRNARMWGKPMLWSIRYAREAQLKFN